MGRCITRPACEDLFEAPAGLLGTMFRQIYFGETIGSFSRPGTHAQRTLVKRASIPILAPLEQDLTKAQVRLVAVGIGPELPAESGRGAIRIAREQQSLAIVGLERREFGLDTHRCVQ